jgi:hypothetical protein
MLGNASVHSTELARLTSRGASAQWYWLKAEELRADAERIRDQTLRQKILDIAQAYENLARGVELLLRYRSRLG